MNNRIRKKYRERKTPNIWCYLLVGSNNKKTSIMKEIICDTNIWYGLGNQSITKPEGVKLIATWINIIEIGFSHPEIKKLLDPEDCKKAAKAILEFADEIIELDPFAYATLKIAPELIIHPKSIKGILSEISQNGLPNSISYQENKSYYDYFMSMKTSFADSINAGKELIRKSEIKNNESKEKFKKSDSDQIEEHAIGLMSDINDFLKKEHEKQLDFSNQLDFDTTKKSVKDLFECFIIPKQLFIKKMILEKSMKMQPNDFFDLLNLIYVDKGKFFWTKEKRWKTVLREAQMDKYLYEQ